MRYALGQPGRVEGAPGASNQGPGDSVYQEERRGPRPDQDVGPQAAAAPLATAAAAAAGSSGRAAAVTSRKAAVRALSFDRKLLLFSLLLHSAAQLTSLLKWRALPAGERFQRVLSILTVFSFWLLPTVAPRFYLTWRKEALIANRLIFFAFPLLRQPRGIQHALEVEANPGARGALRDVFRVAWGSRLVAVVMAALVNPLPLLPLVPHMLVQAYSVVMVRGNSSLCAAPLLAHPLSAQRIHRFHSAMRLLAMLVPGGGLHASHLTGAAADVAPGGVAGMPPQQQRAECEAYLTFLSWTLGWLLPMWLVVKIEPALSLLQWEEAAGSSSSSSRWPLSWAAPSAEALLRSLCGRSWMAPETERSVHSAGVQAGRGRQWACLTAPHRCIGMLLLLLLLWAWAWMLTAP